ncbi:MAG: helix-turn-helix domain-containing protein [Clostridiales bacterium]|nr:helix-turn-helix domain-containing protein [Clostridiales bacterium]
MNVKTASKLYDLRRKHGMSQEDLADELGVSRQAVSKWERAESSPDTDNLIALAKLYRVSLDELVDMDSENEKSGKGDGAQKREEYREQKDGFGKTDRTDAGHGTDGTDTGRGTDSGFGKTDKTDAAYGGSGAGDTADGRFKIDLDDGKSSVHLSLGKIDISDGKGGRVRVDGSGVRVEGKDAVRDFGSNCNAEWDCCGEKYVRYGRGAAARGIVAAVATIGSVIAYLLLGFFLDAWHPAWLVFLSIPFFCALTDAIVKKKAQEFPMVVIAIGVFFALGFVLNAWHPAWVVFLSIPLYHGVVSAVSSRS